MAEVTMRETTSDAGLPPFLTEGEVVVLLRSAAANRKMPGEVRRRLGDLVRLVEDYHRDASGSGSRPFCHRMGRDVRGRTDGLVELPQQTSQAACSMRRFLRRTQFNGGGRQW